MRKRLRRLSRSRAGSAALEMALMTPLFGAVFAGVVDFSRSMMYGMQVTSAAQAGALWAAQSIANSADTTGITAAARADAPNLGTSLVVTSTRACACSNGSTVTCPGSSGSCGDGKSPKITVRVTTYYALDTFVPLGGFTDPVQISAAASYRVQ